MSKPPNRVVIPLLQLLDSDVFDLRRDRRAARAGLGVQLGATQFGDSRIMLSDRSEITKLRTAILTAYERECARKSGDAPPVVVLPQDSAENPSVQPRAREAKVVR